MGREISNVTKLMGAPSLLGSRGFHSNCLDEVFLDPRGREVSKVTK
jgi:hypothetical protein